eukprot:1118231-Rhodomonas_salina.3
MLTNANRTKKHPVHDSQRQTRITLCTRWISRVPPLKTMLTVRSNLRQAIVASKHVAQASFRAAGRTKREFHVMQALSAPAPGKMQVGNLSWASGGHPQAGNRAEGCRWLSK